MLVRWSMMQNKNKQGVNFLDGQKKTQRFTAVFFIT